MLLLVPPYLEPRNIQNKRLVLQRVKCSDGRKMTRPGLSKRRTVIRNDCNCQTRGTRRADLFSKHIEADLGRAATAARAAAPTPVVLVTGTATTFAADTVRFVATTAIIVAGSTRVRSVKVRGRAVTSGEASEFVDGDTLRPCRRVDGEKCENKCFPQIAGREVRGGEWVWARARVRACVHIPRL